MMIELGLVHCTKISAKFEFGVIAPLDAQPPEMWPFDIAV